MKWLWHGFSIWFYIGSCSTGAISGEKRGGMNARRNQMNLGDMQATRLWSCTSRACSIESICGAYWIVGWCDAYMGLRCVACFWMICVIVVLGRLKIILPHVICIYSILVCFVGLVILDRHDIALYRIYENLSKCCYSSLVKKSIEKSPNSPLLYRIS